MPYRENASNLFQQVLLWKKVRTMSGFDNRVIAGLKKFIKSLLWSFYALEDR
jgi:hypothetical protein